MSTRRRAAQRIGVFGGTFDPIHVAHLRCAEEAREALRLDRVLFIPSSVPPHKAGSPLASAEQRLAMIRLAIAGNPGFAASSIEIERPGRSYSVDTLRALRERLGTGSTLVFLLGLDAFREIGTWKEYRTLFELSDIAVLTRPPHSTRRLRALLPVAARKDFCYEVDGETLRHRTGNSVVLLNVTSLEISASAIRARLRQGLSVRYLLPASVERYVQRQRLYAGGAPSS